MRQAAHALYWERKSKTAPVTSANQGKRRLPGPTGRVPIPQRPECSQAIGWKPGDSTIEQEEQSQTPESSEQQTEPSDITVRKSSLVFVFSRQSLGGLQHLYQLQHDPTYRLRSTILLFAQKDVPHSSTFSPPKSDQLNTAWDNHGLEHMGICNSPPACNLVRAGPKVSEVTKSTTKR